MEAEKKAVRHEVDAYNERMKTIVTPLPNAISEETAHVVRDYPYGFKLRCQMKCWIEYNAKHGFRFVSQTSNPKKPGVVWNKPKKSTYSRVAEGLYLDEQGHVQACALSEYSSLQDSLDFKAKYEACLCDKAKSRLETWIKANTAYNEAKARGEVTCQIGNGPVEVLAPEIIK